MGSDMCVPCDEGLINLRVGAIILKEGRIFQKQSVFITMWAELQIMLDAPFRTLRRLRIWESALSDRPMQSGAR